jgi:hypothetical protein
MAIHGRAAICPTDGRRRLPRGHKDGDSMAGSVREATVPQSVLSRVLTTKSFSCCTSKRRKARADGGERSESCLGPNDPDAERTFPGNGSSYVSPDICDTSAARTDSGSHSRARSGRLVRGDDGRARGRERGRPQPPPHTASSICTQHLRHIPHPPGLAA